MYMERKLGNNKTLKNFHINVNGKIVKKYIRKDQAHLTIA